MWCMNMRLFTCSCTFIWLSEEMEWKRWASLLLTPADVKHLCISSSNTDNEWMGGACLSSAPLSPLWSSGKHLLIRGMWSLSKVQNLHHALDHEDGSRCRLSLLCNHADSVFYSHLSRLHLEDFGIDLFRSEMMQSLHNLIFYLICVKKKRYLHWESIEVSALSQQLSSWCV